MLTTLSLAVLAHVGGPPPAWMVAADADFAASYNAGNFSGAAAHYHPDATIIPPPADVFVKGSDAASLFKNFSNSGLKKISLTPNLAFEESATLWHEIGTMEPAGGQYYVRWIKPEGKGWLIAFDNIALNEAPQGVPAAARRATGAPSWLHDKLAFISRSLNQKQYAEAASAWNPGALQVPVDASTFLTQGEVAAALQAWVEPATGPVSLTSTLVFKESDTLYHEIGTATGFGAKAVKYYNRWFNAGGKWWIAVGLSSIGEPKKQ